MMKPLIFNSNKILAIPNVRNNQYLVISMKSLNGSHKLELSLIDAGQFVASIVPEYWRECDPGDESLIAFWDECKKHYKEMDLILNRLDDYILIKSCYVL